MIENIRLGPTAARGRAAALSRALPAAARPRLQKECLYLRVLYYEINRLYLIFSLSK